MGGVADRRGGGVGSGGPWLIQNRCGVPEAGRGMGVETTRLSLWQASTNSPSGSLAGRTATPPNTTTFLSVFPGDDIRMDDDFGER